MRQGWRYLGRVLVGVALASMLCAPLTVARRAPRRFLFVGNSLAYFNDLPSAFVSLAPVGRHPVADGFARPGARLQDDLGNPVLRRLLRFGH